MSAGNACVVLHNIGSVRKPHTMAAQEIGTDSASHKAARNAFASNAKAALKSAVAKANVSAFIDRTFSTVSRIKHSFQNTYVCATCTAR